MLRFKSLTWRLVFLHIVAVAVVAIFLPLVLFWLLTSEVNHLHRDAMRDQAGVLGERLAVERVDHILAGARRCAYRVSRTRR